MKNTMILKLLLALTVIFISTSITTIPVHAESYADAWLKKQKADAEKSLSELEKDGNLTQQAIDASKTSTSKKTNSKTTNKKSSSTKTTTSEGKGWVYSCDELHVVGLPEDSETGYTKSGWYGEVNK